MIDSSEFQKPITGNITAVSQTISLESPNSATQIIQAQGTWSGILVIEGSNDGSTYYDLNVINENTKAESSSIISNGAYSCNTNGFQNLRLRSSAWTSGMANIVAYGSDATSVTLSRAILQDKLGTPITTDNNGLSDNQRLHVATPDTTTSNSTFNALNANVSLNMSGLTGVGFQINSGTFAGTLTPEISIDGGTTWIATSFYDSVGATVLSNITLTNPNATKVYTVITLGGTSHARVRVSSYTSGSATALMRASHGAIISLTPAGAGGGSAAFGTITNTTPSIPNNTATLIANANSARKYLLISNPSGSLCYIGLANTTGLTTSSGIPIPARTFWEIKGDNLFTGTVYAISSSAITFYLSEGTP